HSRTQRWRTSRTRPERRSRYLALLRRSSGLFLRSGALRGFGRRGLRSGCGGLGALGTGGRCGGLALFAFGGDLALGGHGSLGRLLLLDLDRDGLDDELVRVVFDLDQGRVDLEVADKDRVIDLKKAGKVDLDGMRNVLREGLDRDLRTGVEKDSAERAYRRRFVHEVEGHVGMRLLGERDAGEVDVEHAAAH